MFYIVKMTRSRSFIGIVNNVNFLNSFLWHVLKPSFISVLEASSLTKTNVPFCTVYTHV